MLYRGHLAWARFELTTLVVIGIDCKSRCKSNYHTIMTTAAPRAWLNPSCVVIVSSKIVAFNLINTVKPVYSGHLGENDKMTTIYRWPLYGGFEFSTRYCTFVVNKYFLITCYVCLLFCSCGHVTELTLVYIYCWWSYLKVILNKPVSSIL